MLRWLAHRLHPSWLIAWFSAALICGIALSFFVTSSFFQAGPLFIISVCFIVVALHKHTLAAVFLMILAGLLIGLWRGEIVRSQTADYGKLLNHNVRLSGVVADDVTHKNGAIGIKITHISINDIAEGGEIWASSDSSQQLSRGDTLVLEGKLTKGFGTFAASISQATILKTSPPKHIDLTRDMRDKFAAGLRKAVPEPAATLGLGYLTGQHNDLPDTLTKQLQIVGLIHLVIAGGYNVTILVRFARRRLSGTSKYLALLGAGATLLAITLMAGFTAPMARTAIVTGLSLWAWYYGRRIHPLVLLPVAAAITAMIDPVFVWGDVGWYMTFVAYGGLIILAPMIRELFWENEARPSELKQIFVDTLSVQIVTMPIMALAFGQYSIFGLPANLLVLPLMALTMLLTFVAGLGGMLLPLTIAHVFGWPARVLLTYTEKITTWLANANGADAVASFTLPTMVLTYCSLLIIGFIMWRKTHMDFRAVNIVE